jgi:hypothetical protein
MTEKPTVWTPPILTAAEAQAIINRPPVPSYLAATYHRPAAGGFGRPASGPVRLPLDDLYGDTFFETGYVPKTRNLPYQDEALRRWAFKRVFALLLDKGTGKTKVALDKAGQLFMAGRITGLLVVSLKNVHRQWTEAQAPEHLGVPFVADYWRDKPMADDLFVPGDRLAIFSTYIQALLVARHRAAIKRFVRCHGGRVLMVIDESTSIKNWAAQSSRTAAEIGRTCDYRAILTGDPQPKDPLDLFGQFMFLDWRIIGCRYKTAFRLRYCIMGGFKGYSVVGSQNTDELNALLAPWSYTVERQNLPPKAYYRWSYDLHPEAAAHYESLRRSFITELENGRIATAQNAAVAMLRLQQVISGRLYDTDGNEHLIPNSRLAALRELLEALAPPKAVIWAHFNADIHDIKRLLGDAAVTYWGETPTAERAEAVRLFRDPNSGIRYFVGNPAAAGIGVDGLQGECDVVIYYSNSFNALHRWQSEDRTHRIGTYKTVRYYDLVCKGTVDGKVLDNLRRKKSLQSLTLAEIRRMLNA